MIQTVHRQRLQSRVARDEDVSRCGGIGRVVGAAVATQPELVRVAGREREAVNVGMHRAADIGVRHAVRERCPGPAARDRGAIDGTRPLAGRKDRRAAEVDAVRVVRIDRDRKVVGALEKTWSAEQISRMTGDLPPLAGAGIESPYAPHRVVGSRNERIHDGRIRGTHRQADAAYVRRRKSGSDGCPCVAVGGRKHGPAKRRGVEGRRAAGPGDEDARDLPGRARLARPVKAAGGIGFAPVDAEERAGYDAIGVAGIDRHRVHRLSAERGTAGDDWLRHPVRAAVGRYHGTDAEKDRLVAVARADEDPVGIRRVDRDRAAGKRVGAGGRGIKIPGVHQ